MKNLYDWIIAIGIVLGFLFALYAAWIVAILLAIGIFIYIVRVLVGLDKMDDIDEEIQD